MARCRFAGSPAVFVHARIILHHFIGTGHRPTSTPIWSAVLRLVLPKCSGILQLVCQESLGQLALAVSGRSGGRVLPETAYGALTSPIYGRVHRHISVRRIPVRGVFGFFFRRFFPAAEQCFKIPFYSYSFYAHKYSERRAQRQSENAVF